MSIGPAEVVDCTAVGHSALMGDDAIADVAREGVLGAIDSRFTFLAAGDGLPLSIDGPPAGGFGGCIACIASSSAK